jgi:hypothetical protein
MPDTSGLSFYQTDDPTSKSITYGFDVLSADDITVIAIASNGAKTFLTVESGDGYGYTVNLDTKTVTYTGASWTSHPQIYPSSDIRVYRTTSVIPSIDFTAGAVLSESDLDTAYKQGLFAAQEMTEDAADTNAGLQSVTSGVIAAGAVTAPKIATNSISEDRIINSAVTNAKIADNAINAAKIQNGTVDSAELAANCVTTAKIGANQVTTAQIVNSAVTQAKVEKASKGNMEALTGSSGQSQGIVTPDVLRYSQFAPRAYGSLGMASDSDNSFAHSYNVASVSANTHERTVTFTTPLHSNADYVVIATITGTGVAYDAPSIVSKTASGFTIDFNNTDSSGRGIDFVVFGSTLSA